jgi:hypothetical protein
MQSGSALPMLLRTTAWGCVGIVALLALLPGDLEWRTSLPGEAEHALAFAFTGAAVSAANPNRVLWCGLGLVYLAGALELLQTLVPGRGPSVLDASASGAGAVMGVIVAGTYPRLRTRLAKLGNRRCAS